MKQIALIDDNSISRGMLGEIVKAYLKEKNLLAEIDEFSSGEQLLDAADEKDYDVYLMDVIMEGLNGVQISEILRTKGKQGYIIYMTATKAFEGMTKDVDNSCYMLKPVSKTQLFEIFDKLFNN